MPDNKIQDKVSLLCINGILNCIKLRTTYSSSYLFTKSSLYNLDTDVLKFYWSLNKEIEELAKLIVNSPRRLSSALTYEEIETKGNITGIINATETVLLQERTQDPTLFVITQPSTTFNTGNNFLVAWVLNEALNIQLTARKLFKDASRLEWLNEKINLIEKALKNEILNDILVSPYGKRRPNSSVLRSARKSRVPLYNIAVEQFYLLEDIEDNVETEVEKVLSNTIVAYLEHWQRLELGTALKCAEAISKKIKEPVKLTFPFISGSPIASVGPFKIYWQYTVHQRKKYQLDISEKWTREILNFIGLTSSDSRADVAIVYQDTVMSIIECKYFESEGSVSQAIQDASAQIVRYSMDLNPDLNSDTENFINNCIIVVAKKGKLKGHYSKNVNPIPPDNRFVYFLDIDDLYYEHLDKWADELLASC